MKSKLTISRKLLFLWVITTITTLISVAIVFQFLLLRYDETLAREQLSTSYNNLIQQLDARMNEMKSHADTLAKREDISSGVNLVSKYQNKNIYDAIAFDPEKKKLGIQLSEVTVEYSKLIIYDKDLDIIAISDHNVNGDAYVAITSYQDGNPVFLSSLLLNSNYQQSEVPPDLPVMTEIPDNVVIKLVETEDSLSILAIAPILREYVNGSYDVVGMICISDDLTRYVDKNISSLIGLPIQLYSKAQLGNVIEDDQYVFEDGGGEIVALLTGASDVRAESDSHYLSIHPLSLPDGPIAFLGLKLDKLELSAQLNTLRDSVIWVTLGMLVILLSLGRWFITRIITRPIQALLDGIKRVSGGKYGALSLVDTQDELGSLARSFEDMASEVRIREQKLTDILRLAPEGIITVNSDFKITLFSDGAKRIFQYNEKDILGKPIDTLLPDRLREKHVGYMAEFDGSKEDRLIMGRRGEVLGLRNGGEEFPAAASISKLHIGNEKMFTVIIQDITERKNTEAELLSAKINAEAANETKSQFLASMSHDLRTPLNAIIGMSDMMKVEVFGELNAKYREYAEDIVLSGQHLLSLVDELLDISTIEAGKRYLTKEPLSAQAVIGDCFKMLTVRAKQDGVNLSQDIPEDLSDFMADKQAVQKILLNLLSNAIKFSPIKGDVCISAHESQTHVIMTIKDNGMGIPQDKIADLMQPFTRYEKDAHKPVEGWGLGLAISKSLVDLHNGSIWIDSAIGEGTEVHVSFPKE